MRSIIYPWAQIAELSALIRSIYGRPANPEVIAKSLAADHGVRAPPARVPEKLALDSC